MILRVCVCVCVKVQWRGCIRKKGGGLLIPPRRYSAVGGRRDSFSRLNTMKEVWF